MSLAQGPGRPVVFLPLEVVGPMVAVGWLKGSIEESPSSTGQTAR